MGIFADIMAVKPGWPADWDPESILAEWYTYINVTIQDASEALMSAPAESKQRKVYEDAVKKMEENRVIAVAKYGKVNQTVQVKTNISTQLLAACDQRAMLIESHGNLYLKELQVARIFRGEWTPVATRAIPAPHALAANTYSNKHFGGDKKAAWYLGDFDKNLKLVKALEEKAIESGLDVPGSCVFRFDTMLGWDGENDARGTSNTHCIRVDSIGFGQHSHPLPETGLTCVSHQKLICTAIVEAVESNDLERLVTIAQYLTTIKADKDEYKLVGAPLRLRMRTAKLAEGNIGLPECKFWSE